MTNILKKALLYALFLTDWNLAVSMIVGDKAAVMSAGYVYFMYTYLRGLSALLVLDFWARPKPQSVGRVTVSSHVFLLYGLVV